MINLGDIIDEIIAPPASASVDSKQDSRGTFSRGSSHRLGKESTKEIRRERKRQASKRNRDKQRIRMIQLEKMLQTLQVENYDLQLEIQLLKMC
mmetsp:Transcript_27910/g.70114  ORF Transcript_27910/g.70114 Transcript_27910/m.70114 type:complete len:94 (-) Transcript_27910:22-303(-)